MTSPIQLPQSYAANLLAIRNAQRNVDLATERLASGRKVNTALDNPQNFFTSRALSNRASDLARLLDGIGSNIRVIEEAASGVKAVENLLRIGESYAQNKLDDLRAGDVLPVEPAAPTVPALNTQILASNPVGYWQLNETAGATATNLGSIGAAANANYLNGPTLGAQPLYEDATGSVALNGTNQSISVPNHPQLNTSVQPRRSVELVFNANTTSGRQVLYEEGGGTNAFSIYVFNGSLYLNGRDAGAWGPVNISIPITAGETYHVGFTFDFPNAIFRGYVNGVEIGNAAVNASFPSHSGNIGIGRMDNATWFHDGAQSGSNHYFNGRISDVAIYNSVLSDADFENRATAVLGTSGPDETDPLFDEILSQIDLQVKDAHYRGINLLRSDNLTSFFNEDGTSLLELEGMDFTSNGLGIKRTSFLTEEGIEGILQSLRDALEEVRGFGSTLSNALAIITTRRTFTAETVNVLKSGAALLTDADQNEEGANLLAAQTRQNLATTSLALANTSYSSVLNLFA